MRRFVAVVLGTLAAVMLTLTLIAWAGMTTEVQLHHDIGDDSKMFAAAVMACGVAWFGLSIAALMTWRWQGIKARWRAERQLLRESRG